MGSSAWYVTLNRETRGPRRRTMRGLTFDANVEAQRTHRMQLPDEVKKELAASGDYTFRPAAATGTGEPLTRKDKRQGVPKAAPAPDPAKETADPDPGPASSNTAEEA